MCLCKVKLFVFSVSRGIIIILLLLFSTDEIYPEGSRTPGNWYVRKQFQPVNYHWLSLGAEGEIVNNSNISHVTQFTLTSGRYIDFSNFIQISGALGWMYLKNSSPLRKNIEGDVKAYNFYLEFKSHQPSYVPGIIQYFLFGFGMDFYYYKYKTPVIIEYYYEPYRNTVVEKIQDDHFTAFNIHAGFGFNLAEINNFRINAEMSPGLRLPSTSTFLGMDNPLLKKSFYIKFKLSVCFPFGEL